MKCTENTKKVICHENRSQDFFSELLYWWSWTNEAALADTSLKLNGVKPDSPATKLTICNYFHPINLPADNATSLTRVKH